MLDFGISVFRSTGTISKIAKAAEIHEASAVAGTTVALEMLERIL